MKRLFFYTRQQFFNFRMTKMAIGVEFLSMSKVLSQQMIDALDENQEYFVDISSMVGFAKANDSKLLNFEQIVCYFGRNVSFICDKVYEEDAKYIFRYIFDEFEYIDVECVDKPAAEEEKPDQQPKSVRKITDLTDIELEHFFESFDSRLYGHERFKEEFKELVNSFRVFNRLGEHKILSFFLMGDSGVGKTEVARSIHKALGSKAKLAKINFGNYSSHDALNSLIGSPLGYIGSDGGELLKRISESDVGLILIDEFEKADNAVFNYFLDVLENGKIVNSQAYEHDVSGYIIVFTSNITRQDFKSRISPELRSRFDYKGVFNLLTDADKKKFVHFRVNQIISKYTQLVADDLPDKLHDIIVGQIDVSQYKNMRDLNKRIKDSFVSCLKNRANNR